MRRWIALLLAVVLTATGCAAAKPQTILTETEAQGVVPGRTETDFPGVEIRILGFDPADGGTLTVVWENKTEYEVTYGEAYTIQRQGEDCWVSCQRQPGLAFHAIGYLLMPGQTRTEKYSLRYTYDVSAPGTYRFESTCFVQNTPNESAKCTLSAEFTVTAGDMGSEEIGTEAGKVYHKPPTAKICLPDGTVSLAAVVYEWTIEHGDGLATTTITDLMERPLPADRLETGWLNPQDAESVYVLITDSSVAVPTNSLGYPVKLDWEAEPADVTCVCWPDTVWKGENIPEETVVFIGEWAFYAKSGGHIYEIVAVWEDNGAGYHGRAAYYVYLTDEQEHIDPDLK